MATSLVLCVRMFCAKELGVYCSSSMTRSTFSRVLSETYPLFKTRETVDLETPAFFATSSISALVLLPYYPMISSPGLSIVTSPTFVITIGKLFGFVTISGPSGVLIKASSTFVPSMTG